MNNLVKQDFQRGNDDELDLYEIIDILIKRKKTIIIIFITVFLISLCGGIYIKNKTPNYIVRDVLINQYAAKTSTENQKEYEVTGVNKVLPENMYLLNKRTESFFEIPEVTKIYENNTDLKNRNFESKREFLKNIISFEKNKNRYTIKVKILKNKEISKQILNQYIDNLQKMDNFSERISMEKSELKKNLNQVDKELDNLTKEMDIIFSKDKNIEKIKFKDQIEYMSYRYPEIFLKRKEIERYHDYYTNDLLFLNEINDTNVVKIISDSYMEDGKSKAKLVVGVGTVIALFLGIMMGFLKEFIDGYKKRYKK